MGKRPIRPPPRCNSRAGSTARSAAAAAPAKRRRSFWRKLWLGIQIGFVVAIILGCILGYFVYEKALVYYARAETYDLKKLDDLNVTSTFYDVNGEELGRIFVEDRIVLKPEEIPEAMREAVMAAEDRRFYQHGAIDYWGILRAFREDLSKKSHGVQGGSTIEQQLAKHLIGDFSRTMDRKFLEAFVAIRLEQASDQGPDHELLPQPDLFREGVLRGGAAARGYFGKEAMDLTVPECALLAGIIRAPTSSSPRVDLGESQVRRDATLKQMEEEGTSRGKITSRYINTPIRIQPAKPSGLQTFVMAAAVKEMEQILSIEGTEEMPQGLTVRTNIDLHLQRAIEEQMNLQLADLEKTSGAGRCGADSPPAQRGRRFRARPLSPISPRDACWPGSADAIFPRASSITSPWRAARMARCSSRFSTPWLRPSRSAIRRR
jgi:membrane peptidoglycan carboxypeptidase